MKRRVFMALLLAGILPVATHAQEPPSNFVMRPAPVAMPEITFMNHDGKQLTLANFKGKTILLNVWATWCVPCRKEMPSLDRLQAILGGPDFEVVAMSSDKQGMGAIDPFYLETGLTHLNKYIAQDANRSLDKLGLYGIPATFLIDGQGQNLGQLIGSAEWDTPEMIAFLNAIINKQKEQ